MLDHLALSVSLMEKMVVKFLFKSISFVTLCDIKWKFIGLTALCSTKLQLYFMSCEMIRFLQLINYLLFLIMDANFMTSKSVFTLK